MLPSGGNKGQVLTKSSSNDYEYSWEDNYEIKGVGVPEGELLLRQEHIIPKVLF